MARETDTDTALLRRARHDAEAFGQFYERHARRIYACLARETGNADLAADLTAETFAEALRAVHRFRGVHAASGAAWISAIALNVLRHYQRSDRARTSARRRLGIRSARPSRPTGPTSTHGRRRPRAAPSSRRRWPACLRASATRSSSR